MLKHLLLAMLCPKICTAMRSIAEQGILTALDKPATHLKNHLEESTSF